MFIVRFISLIKDKQCLTSFVSTATAFCFPPLSPKALDVSAAGDPTGKILL